MHLPFAPTVEEKYMYQCSGRWGLYPLSVITTTVLLVGMGFFVVINPMLAPYTLFFFITAFYLSISYVIGVLAKDFDFSKHFNLVMKHFEKSAHEEVDIFLPICGEPLEVLKNTWQYVKELRDAHEGKINVHVLDDGKSHEARLLAAKCRFHYITRENNTLKKAGNLRNAFTQTTAPFILIIDADFAVRRDFLLETLPYMYEDTSIGIVQTPQFFDTHEGLGLVERGSAQIQELFYRLIQVSRNHFNGAICVGTSALYRRSALEPHGGTAAIGHSEDVRTSVLVMNDGGKLQYLPIILSKGLCPDTWKQYFTMMYRWSTGSLSLMLDKNFWKNNLSWVQKLCFCTGFFFYVTTGLASVMAFLPSIYLLIFKPEYLFWFNIGWAIPSILLTNIYLRYWQKTGYSWAAVQCRAVAGYAHLFALVDIFLKSTEQWIPTGSGGKSGKFDFFMGFVRYHNMVLWFVLYGLIFYRVPTVGAVNLIPLALMFLYHVLTLSPVLRK
jgi:cellulose synthase (UDP-forming)